MQTPIILSPDELAQVVANYFMLVGYSTADAVMTITKDGELVDYDKVTLQLNSTNLPTTKQKPGFSRETLDRALNPPVGV